MASPGRITLCLRLSPQPHRRSRSNGADTGACYLANQSCSQISEDRGDPNAGTARAWSGAASSIASTACTRTRCRPPWTSLCENAYYAGQLVINQPDGSSIGGAIVYPPNDPSGARPRLSLDHRKRPRDHVDQRTAGHRSPGWRQSHTRRRTRPYQQPPYVAVAHGIACRRDGFNCLSERGRPERAEQSDDRVDGRRNRSACWWKPGVATRDADGAVSTTIPRAPTP